MNKPPNVVIIVLVAWVIGVIFGVIIQQVPLGALLYHIVAIPWVRPVSSVLAAFGGVLIAIYSPAITNKLKSPPEPLSLTAGLLFLTGSIFVIWGAVTTFSPPSGTNQASYVIDLSYEDDFQLAPGETFAKGWRVYNRGTTTWKSYEVRRVDWVNGKIGPEGFTIPQEVPPGTDVNIYTPPTQVPINPGCYRNEFRLFAQDSPAPFGDPLWLQIVVGPPGPKNDYGVFVDDENVRDGTLMTPNQLFIKGWVLHNCGDNAWFGYRAQRVSGIFGPNEIVVPFVAPHQNVSLRAQMTAPSTPADNYTAVYKLQTSDGRIVINEFSVNIKVK